MTAAITLATLTTTVQDEGAINPQPSFSNLKNIEKV
jgi:hypothetical protein